MTEARSTRLNCLELGEAAPRTASRRAFQMQTQMRDLLTEGERGEVDSGAEAGDLSKHSSPDLSGTEKPKQTAGPTPLFAS